jgi:hypothetical protein
MTYGGSSQGLTPSATGTNPLKYSTGAMKEKIPSGYKKGSLQQFTPEQMQLFQQQFGQVAPDSYLSRLAGGDQSMFGEIEAPALRQFNALQGNIASRFSGMGGGGNQRALGGRKSSGFQNTINSAASNFAQELQSNRQGLQRQALMDLMGLSNSLLGQRPYQNFLIKKEPKQSGLGGILGGAVGGIGGFFAGGGPAGALAGAKLGYDVGSSFGGGRGSTGGGGGGGGGFGNYDLSPFEGQDFLYNVGDYFSPGI